MTGRYEHVLAFALEHPWAVTSSMRAMIVSILARRIAGHDIDAAELSALVSQKNLPQATRGGGVAVIPMYGVIAPRMNLLSEFSGGTTFETLTSQLHDALANEQVKTIVFDVNSPGGNVAGATEFAHEVLKGRTQKPIIAVAQYLMASAAYWPMSCATEIVASKSAMVGAIGVYHIHNDISEALAKEGIKREVITAGKFKAEGADGGALSDDARAHLQGLIDGNYKQFTEDISKGRGVSVASVRNGFGEGRVVRAEDALEAGMINRIGTLAETLARLLPTTSARTPAPIATTRQEPFTATRQESVDALWQNGIDAELLSLDL